MQNEFVFFLNICVCVCVMYMHMSMYDMYVLWYMCNMCVCDVGAYVCNVCTMACM